MNDNPIPLLVRTVFGVMDVTLTLRTPAVMGLLFSLTTGTICSNLLLEKDGGFSFVAPIVIFNWSPMLPSRVVIGYA
jgi:hypothetical protein